MFYQDFTSVTIVTRIFNSFIQKLSVTFFASWMTFFSIMCYPEWTFWKMISLTGLSVTIHFSHHSKRQFCNKMCPNSYPITFFQKSFSYRRTSWCNQATKVYFMPPPYQMRENLRKFSGFHPDLRLAGLSFRELAISFIVTSEVYRYYEIFNKQSWDWLIYLLVFFFY